MATSHKLPTTMPALSQRILIFDSGIGGLSVLRSAYQFSPQHNYHYLADDAWWPYGPKSHIEIQDRLKSLFSSLDIDTQFDVVVIACNTASTSALESLRHHFQTPIIGVVPAIKPAALSSKTKTIALLATQTTVKGIYVQQLHQEHAADCTLIGFALPELVVLSEESLNPSNNSLTAPLQVVINQIKAHPDSNQIDTFVLGCTHFPLLKNELIKLWGEPANWVDSGMAIANRIEQISQTLPNNIHLHSTPTLYTTSPTSTKAKVWLPHLHFSGIQQAVLIENNA